MTKNKPTQAHLNSLTDFRQQVYALFENQRDVLFEIMDAIEARGKEKDTGLCKALNVSQQSRG